jgi:hypothetical protein
MIGLNPFELQIVSNRIQASDSDVVGSVRQLKSHEINEKNLRLLHQFWQDNDRSKRTTGFGELKSTE